MLDEDDYCDECGDWECPGHLPCSDCGGDICPECDGCDCPVSPCPGSDNHH